MIDGVDYCWRCIRLPLSCRRKKRYHVGVLFLSLSLSLAFSLSLSHHLPGGRWCMSFGKGSLGGGARFGAGEGRIRDGQVRKLPNHDAAGKCDVEHIMAFLQTTKLEARRFAMRAVRLYWGSLLPMVTRRRHRRRCALVWGAPGRPCGRHPSAMSTIVNIACGESAYEVLCVVGRAKVDAWIRGGWEVCFCT